VIEARGVTVRYGGVPAVDGVDLSVAAGEVVGLIGPNGAGKTTLVECVEGLRRPDAGWIRVAGLDPRADRAAMARICGVQLQSVQYPPRASVDDVGRLFAGCYPRGVDYRDLLAQVGLAQQRRTQVTRLSGGQQQRLSLALALLGRPRLVVLDELTTGLDPAARRDIWELLRERNNAGLTVLLTSHHMDEVEYLCDRVGVLVRGRLAALDTPSALIRAHTDGRDRLVLDGASGDAELRAALTAVTGVSVAPAGGRLLVTLPNAAARARVAGLRRWAA